VQNTLTTERSARVRLAVKPPTALAAAGAGAAGTAGTSARPRLAKDSERGRLTGLEGSTGSIELVRVGEGPSKREGAIVLESSWERSDDAL
jgi:hypothetical protein